MRTMQKFTVKKAGQVPLDELAVQIERAVADERYEDAAVLRDELERRNRFLAKLGNITAEDQGPFYAFFGHRIPISYQQLVRTAAIPVKPYMVFNTYQEALAWLEENRG